MGGTKPWPEVPVGNKDHTRAAVVIIGAGISGTLLSPYSSRSNTPRHVHGHRPPQAQLLPEHHPAGENPDWTRAYPGQEEILEYLRNVASKYNLYKYIRFNSAVESAAWDDDSKRWKVDVKVTGGKDAEFSSAYSIETDFLVSAVGQLNQPRYPKIEGLEDFQGKVMHSARWDWSYDMQGKKIGVIGNGMCCYVSRRWC
ncbi:hypothetical protein OPT61_g10263 [Boeremia exigua]|uniref:Uncharacterized protein n=1 Tax=Boeremia exigua TaxID=749465 RepID=A0ACC2HR99_9PLEO|nr:hypothetical protein OPT61_g10263 [Boeremia exigua]